MRLEDERKLSEQYSGWRRVRMWRDTHHVDLGQAELDSLAIIRRLRQESRIILSAPDTYRAPRWVRPQNFQITSIPTSNNGSNSR